MTRRRSLAAPLLLGAALIVLAVVAIRRASAPRWDEGEVVPPEARGKVLADYGEVAEFEFVDQDGKRFTRADLAGRVWVLDFFFTTCAGPCIDLTAKMRNLAGAFVAEPDVGFLSVSVDPETDTPEVLRRYAASSGADSERWRWLTGDRAQVKKLAANFLAALGDKLATGDIPHSTRLHVIGRDGRLRAIHDTQLEGWKDDVVHSVRLLLAQPASGAAASK